MFPSWYVRYNFYSYFTVYIPVMFSYKWGCSICTLDSLNCQYPNNPHRSDMLVLPPAQQPTPFWQICTTTKTTAHTILTDLYYHKDNSPHHSDRFVLPQRQQHTAFWHICTTITTTAHTILTWLYNLQNNIQTQT